MKIRLICILILLLAAAPAAAAIDIDPDVLPAWDKVSLTGRTTYMMDDTRDLAVYLPDGWVTVEGEGRIILVGSSLSALDSIEEDGPAADEIAGAIFVLTNTALAEIGVMEQPPTPREALVLMINELIDAAEVPLAVEPLVVELDDRQALLLPLEVPVNDGPAVDALAFIFEVDDTLVFTAFGFGAERTDAYSLAEVFAIVSRLRLMAPIESSDTDLTQSITISSTDLGMLTVRYPGGYVASDEGDGAFVIANNLEALDALDLNDSPTAVAIQPGQFAVLGLGFPPEFAELFGIEEGEGPAEGLTALVDTLALDDDETVFNLGEPESLTFEDTRAAIVAGAVSEGDVTNDAAFIMIEADEGYVLLLAFAAEGSMEEYDAVLRAMAASVEYSPPDSGGA